MSQNIIQIVFNQLNAPLSFIFNNIIQFTHIIIVILSLCYAEAVEHGDSGLLSLFLIY